MLRRSAGKTEVPEVAFVSGKIIVIFGPMYSGKSTELLRLARRFKLIGMTVLYIKFDADVRYDANSIVTHDMVSEQAVPCSHLEPMDALVQQHDVIAIDEGQFYPDLPDLCDKWANEGKIVIVAGLSGTFARKGFNQMPELLALADEIIPLTAVCHNKCGRDAPFTFRVTDETDVEIIGGKDKYMALCRPCFKQLDSSKQQHTRVQ